MKSLLILLLLLISPDLLDHLESSDYLEPCSVESINLVKAIEDKQQAETERLQTKSEYERTFAEWIIATNEADKTFAKWIHTKIEFEKTRSEIEKSTNPDVIKIFIEWKQALTEQDRVNIVFEEASFNKEKAFSKYDKAKLEWEKTYKILEDCLNGNENKI